MDLGERKNPSSTSAFREYHRYVEDFDESRTPLADFFGILLESDADFIQVSKQVGRVLVDPIGSSPLQLVPSIAPGEQSHR